MVAVWKMQPDEVEGLQGCIDKGDFVLDFCLLNKSAMENGKLAVEVIRPVFLTPALEGLKFHDQVAVT